MKRVTLFFKYWNIRIFIELLTVIVLFEAYVYAFHYRSDSFSDFVFHLSNDLYFAPKWLNMVEFFILFFVLAFVVIFFMTIYYNYSKLSDEKNDKAFVERLLNKIFLFLYPIQVFSTKQIKTQLKEIKRNLRSIHSKMFFIYYLQEIHNQTKGSIAQKTHYLIDEIGYTFFLKALLKSPYMNYKLFALKAIGDFEMEGFEPYILKLTKKRNQLLRSEAIITLLKLNVYTNLFFLLDLNLKLTLWDVNRIIATVQELKIVNIHYASLIKSDDDLISALGIILARLNGRIEFSSEIRSVLSKTKNTFVKEQAVIALGEFSQSESDFIQLLDLFDQLSFTAKKELLNNITFVNDEKYMVTFLQQVINNQHVSLMQIAMTKLRDLDVNYITIYKDSDNLLIKEVYYQVLDINL